MYNPKFKIPFQPEAPIEKVNQWSPYNYNGGSCIALCNEDFFVVAADTRLTQGYSILDRNATKVFQITKDIFLTSTGMQADVNQLLEDIEKGVEMYKYDTGVEINFVAVQKLISRILYSYRSRPLYAFCVLAGFQNGKAVVCDYDVTGCSQINDNACSSNAKAMIMPIIDVIKGRNGIAQAKGIEELEHYAVDILQSLAERDTTTGDKCKLYVVKYNQEPIYKEYLIRAD